MNDDSNLTSSIISDDNLFNNYKYSYSNDINILITVDKLLTIIITNDDLKNTLFNIKNNINLLPDFIKTIKNKNHRLALNIMDFPKLCFDKTFKFLNDTSDIYQHKSSIDSIINILPNYTIFEVFNALKLCDYNIDITINYLFDSNYII